MLKIVEEGIMSVEDNKLLIRDYFEEVVNTGNVSEIEKYIAPSYADISGGQKRIVGIEGAKEHIIGVRETYSDLTIKIEQQIAEGEWVVSCVTAKGTHDGHWLGMKPTGKSVTITAVNVDRVVNGMIVEHGGAANTFEALLEIGAIEVVR